MSWRSAARQHRQTDRRCACARGRRQLPRELSTGPHAWPAHAPSATYEAARSASTVGSTLAPETRHAAMEKHRRWQRALARAPRGMTLAAVPHATGAATRAASPWGAAAATWCDSRIDNLREVALHSSSVKPGWGLLRREAVEAGTDRLLQAGAGGRAMAANPNSMVQEAVDAAISERGEI